ncbi:MAG: hypothetical protein R3B46_07170 [Phycisphaerales bacterium]
MGWRRHLGPPEWVLVGLWIFLLTVGAGFVYSLVVNAIELRWESIRGMGQTRGLATTVVIERNDGSLTVVDASEDGFDRLAFWPVEDMKSRVMVDTDYDFRTERRAWDLWSDRGERVDVRFFVRGPDQYSAGGPLTKAQEMAIVRHAVERDREGVHPLLAQISPATMSASGTNWESVRHNIAHGAALVIVWGGFVFIGWRVLRWEILYRRCWLKDCAGCGASLSGLAVQRCPSCGAATGRRLWFVVESFRLARRIVRWGAELFSGSRDWKRWWRYSGWAIAARILMYVVVSITIMVVGMTVITHFWQPLPYSSRASGSSTHAYRLPDGTLYADPIGYPMTEREREIQETSERLSFMVYVHEDVTASRARYWLECRPMGTDKFTIEETDYAPIVAAFDRANPGRVPKPLVQSGGAPVTIPHPPGVKHSIATAILTLLTLGGFTAAIIRMGMTHKGSPSHPECPKCFYSLEGNTTGVCPECGHRLGGDVSG